MAEEKDDIVSYLEKKGAEINSVILEYISVASSPRSIEKLLGRSGYKFDHKALDEGVLKPSMYILEQGGKRWRPTLMLLIIEALGKDPDAYLEFALIPEVIHNGTLVHDDVEDSSQTRRGQPAVYIKYGVDVAVNLGDFMYYFPMNALVDSPKLSEQVKGKALAIYIKEMTRICIGQATDIIWHKNRIVDPKTITEDKYLEMANDKTGVLARMAAKMGGALAEADDQTIEALGRFGASIGVAFQIQDDVLNIYPSGVSANKGGVGDDISEGKITLLVVHALSKLKNGEGKRLIEILGMHTKDKALIDEAIAIIDGTGARKYVDKVAVDIVKDAWEGISKRLPESRAKARIKALADYLISRTGA
ncbi:MAG TPA: polyprenyl synthetase family protein [Candidatus Acidoferrales bacterium]|nr:polyprenyl synthetase family protein [Candidatus Acidoferrales bacterium]